MPQGFVIFAGNNARLKGYAWYDWLGQFKGYLESSPMTGLISTKHPTDKKLRRYTAISHAGLRTPVDAPAEIPRRGCDAISTVTGMPDGKLVKQEVKDAAGVPKMRNDSVGMFEAVALKLKKLYSLPKNLVKEFSNVHDDFAEGGTKADSKTNFFDAVKSAPGVGGASELDFFAYAGHGEAAGLPSAGLGRGDAKELGKQIRRLCRADATVIFYACCTGSPGGFAKAVSDECPGMTVWGHLKAGPASVNPNKVKFKAGQPVPFLDTLTAEERLKWDNYMRSSADFYARYPFMTMEEIRAEIGL